MMRKARTLSLALVAALAVLAVVASGAWATAFHAPSGLTKLTGAQEQQYEHKFTVTHGAVTCEKVTFSGEASGSGLASIEVTPAFTNCLFAGVWASVSMNGCRFRLQAEGRVAVVCPAGKEITVTSPELGTVKCTIHIPAQTFLTLVSYTNLGASPTREITANANIFGIKYSQTEGSGLGKCAAAIDTNGTYVGKALFTGENSAGTAHTDIIWTA